MCVIGCGPCGRGIYIRGSHSQCRSSVYSCDESWMCFKDCVMVFNACVYVNESVKCHGGVYSQWQGRKKTQHQVTSNIQVKFILWRSIQVPGQVETVLVSTNLRISNSTLSTQCSLWLIPREKPLSLFTISYIPIVMWWPGTVLYYDIIRQYWNKLYIIYYSFESYVNRQFYGLSSSFYGRRIYSQHSLRVLILWKTAGKNVFEQSKWWDHWFSTNDHAGLSRLIRIRLNPNWPSSEVIS